MKTMPTKNEDLNNIRLEFMHKFRTSKCQNLTAASLNFNETFVEPGMFTL